MALDIPADLSPAARKFATFDAVYFKAESFFNFLSGLAIFGVMLLGVIQVVGRSAFNVPVRGYVDIVEVAITIFAFLGLAYCQKLNGHVRMEIIIGRFKGRALWLTEIFGTYPPETGSGHQCFRCTQRPVRIRGVDGDLTECRPDLFCHQALADNVEIDVWCRHYQILDSIGIARFSPTGPGLDD